MAFTPDEPDFGDDVPEVVPADEPAPEPEPEPTPKKAKLTTKSKAKPKTKTEPARPDCDNHKGTPSVWSSSGRVASVIHLCQPCRLRSAE